MTDTLQKFLFNNATVRGELVELNTAWQQVLSHHKYPLPVQNLLGELTCAAALLCANIKFDGSLIMQIHGDGAIKLLVVECNEQLQLRAMAKLAENAVIAEDASLAELINAHGNGRFSITLDPSDKMPGQRPYQGIVTIDGETVATVIENYMKQSEQLDTKLWLASDHHVSRGMLLQRLPFSGGTVKPETNDAHIKSTQMESAEETWNRVCLLGGTLKRDELLSTPTTTLLHRLFWEESVRVFEPQNICFSCSCSREKVGNMLSMLGREEVTEAVTCLGKLDINCDFCGKPYSFDAVDCAQLFLSPDVKINPTTKLLA